VLGRFGGGVHGGVDAEVVEEVFFGEAVHPVLFGDFVAWAVLAGAREHGVEFGDGGFALSGVGGVVFGGEGLDEIRAFEDDAAAGMAGGGFAEVAEEGGSCEDVVDAAGVADIFACELDDGAGFDVAAWADVVADACGHGAEGLTFVIVVGVDDGDGDGGAFFDDEAADAGDLVGSEGPTGR